MDELNQKPTKPMLAEARRLAFFADEVLSQDILNSYEKTEKYIKRHTQILTEKGMIQKVLQPHHYYTKEEIQESKRWRDRMVRRLIHWPLAIYIALSLYLLVIDMNDWFFNLGQFNSLFIEWFPKAQYWVNISIVFKDKMVVQYIIFHIFSIYVLLAAVYLIIVHWRRFNVDFIPGSIKECKVGKLRKFASLAIFTLVVFLSFDMSTGSPFLLSLDQIGQESTRRGIFSEYQQWNSIIGFLIVKGVFMAGPGASVFWGALIISSIRNCKNKTLKAS